MAVRKLDRSVPDSRIGVTMRQDPTRIDPRKLKLGKGVARHDPRTLLLASYVTPGLPVPPASVSTLAMVGVLFSPRRISTIPCTISSWASLPAIISSRPRTSASAVD